MNAHPLDRLFQPRGVAVVGGSERPGSVGQVLLHNLLAGGYGGALHVVNHRRDQVQGLPAVPSLRALERGSVDLAVVAVPAESVPSVIADCGATGVPFAAVLSAGFGERGAEGLRRQEALIELANRAGVRLVGPNCLGLERPGAGLHAFFGLSRALPGRLALVSQSGAVCTAIVDWAVQRELGFSTVISLGAAADLGFGDVFDYLALDAQTDAIVVYIEGVDHPRSFMSGLRAAARMKPVIALKAGRAVEGTRAAKSHTGALIGDDAVFESALRRAGAVRAATLEQLYSATELLARGLRSRGNRVAIVTNAGGLGVMAADRIAGRELALAELGEATRQRLDAALPPHWSHGNPIDVIGDAPPERFAAALEPVVADPEVDGAIVLLSPQSMTKPLAVAELTVAASDATHKPILACFMGGEQVREAKQRLALGGVPVLATPEAAVDAFAHLARFERNQRLLLQLPGPLSEQRAPDLHAAHAIVAQALAEGRSELSLREAKALLEAFFIPVTPSLPAHTPEQASAAAERLGFPVAMKIDSPQISHKSDVGGVRLDLATPEAVASAFREMMSQAARLRPDAELRGVTLEPMRSTAAGRELLAGIAHDPAFGPAIGFGAGGTLVELMADRSVALPPLNSEIARDMIARTRVHKLLGPYRGMPAVDLEAVQAVLLRLSELACELPEVQELDINPLIADARGVVAADARVTLRAVERQAVPYAHLAIAPYPSNLVRDLQLGQDHLVLRPIRPEDAALERQFVSALSAESRYLRFHQGLLELTPRMLARFTQLDYDREMAFIAIAKRDGTEEAAGIVRYVRTPDGQGCEFALAVADAWQGRGLGSALMRALCDCARERGLRRMQGEVLTVNGKMIELMRFLGFEVRAHPSDATLKRVAIEL